MAKIDVSENTALVTTSPKEKILFDIQSMMLPTILNLENLTMIGFTFVIVLMALVFHFGVSEFLIVGALYLLIAIPSLTSIFHAGSTSYVLTNQRLLIFTINLKSKERSIPLDQIQSVTTKSSGLQKFYGAGDILIYVKGVRKPIKLTGLKDCKHRAEQIRQAVRKARNQV